MKAAAWAFLSRLAARPVAGINWRIVPARMLARHFRIAEELADRAMTVAFDLADARLSASEIEIGLREEFGA